MNNVTFANPEFFYLLAIIPLLVVWYVLRQRNASPALTYSHTDQFAAAGSNWRIYLRHSLIVLRLLALAALIVVLARPQRTDKWQESSAEGINIMLVMDVSSSMLAEDFTPNRLEASKDIAMKFIAGRETDRIGLVVFSGESFTQCPLTTDHAVLTNYFKEVKSGLMEDGTAIGVGLATAVNRLKEVDSPSKVAILLTDGENNQGAITPVDAAKIAESFGVRVYTIGVGSRGTAPYPVQTPFGRQYQQVEVRIDEGVLTDIAETTGGQYFRATDNQSLASIYEEIDAMEKAKIDVKKYSQKDEEFLPWALLALALVGIEVLLRYTLFRHLP